MPASARGAVSEHRSIGPLYLGLAVVGYAAPAIPTIMETLESGNILFWTQPLRTFSELFVNKTSTAFALDLLASALVACVWMVVESRRVGLARPWRFVVLTLLFGLGGTLPLFLWFRERRLGRLRDDLHSSDA
jgi:hypothetical protein